MSRKEVEAGQGLMIWITQTFPQTRSHLCIFYEVLARPRATNITLTREQLHLLVNSVDEELVIHANVPGVPRTPGTKLLQLKNEQMLNKADALRFKPSKVRTFGRVLDPRSRNVNMTDDARRVAKLWLATAAGTPLWKSMLRYSIPQGVTLKADAKADEHGIGIGGWLSVEAQPSRGSAFWFAYQLKLEDFPKEWELPPEPQRAIACFETLAQTYLLLMARHLVCNASLPIYRWGQPRCPWSRTILQRLAPPTSYLQIIGRWPSSLSTLRTGRGCATSERK